jgi:hypothetical protein
VVGVQISPVPILSRCGPTAGPHLGRLQRTGSPGIWKSPSLDLRYRSPVAGHAGRPPPGPRCPISAPRDGVTFGPARRDYRRDSPVTYNLITASPLNTRGSEFPVGTPSGLCFLCPNPCHHRNYQMRANRRIETPSSERLDASAPDTFP